MELLKNRTKSSRQQTQKPPKNPSFLSNYYISTGVNLHNIKKAQDEVFVLERAETEIQFGEECKQGTYYYVRRVALGDCVEGMKGVTYEKFIWDNLHRVSRFEDTEFNPYTLWRSNEFFNEEKRVLNYIPQQLSKAFKEIELIGSLVQKRYLNENNRPTKDIEEVLKQEVPATYFLLSSIFEENSTKREFITFLQFLFSKVHRYKIDFPDEIRFVFGGRNNTGWTTGIKTFFKGMVDLFGEGEHELVGEGIATESDSRLNEKVKHLGFQFLVKNKLFCTYNAEELLYGHAFFEDWRTYVIETTLPLSTKVKEHKNTRLVMQLAKEFGGLDVGGEDYSADCFAARLLEHVPLECKTFFACLSLLPFYDRYRSSGIYIPEGNYFYLELPNSTVIGKATTFVSSYRQRYLVESVKNEMEVDSVVEYMIQSPEVFEKFVKELLKDYKSGTVHLPCKQDRVNVKQLVKQLERQTEYIDLERCEQAFDLCLAGVYTYRSVRAIEMIVAALLQAKEVSWYSDAFFDNSLASEYCDDVLVGFVKVDLQSYGFRPLEDSLDGLESVYAREGLSAKKIKEQLGIIADRKFASITRIV